jgi:hypothetical protein
MRSQDERNKVAHSETARRADPGGSGASTARPPDRYIHRMKRQSHALITPLQRYLYDGEPTPQRDIGVP